MNIQIFCPAKKDLQKQSLFGFSKALFCGGASCALLFLMQLAMSFFGYPLFERICSAFGADPLGAMAQALYQLVAYILLFSTTCAVAFWLFRVTKTHSAPASLGPAPKLPLLYVFGTVGVSYIFSLLSTTLFSDFLEKEPIGAMPLPDSVAGIFVSFVSIALMPAIFEELLFRGIILKNLLPFGKWPAIIVSSLLFGAMHTDLPKMPGATVFGFCLAVLYCCTGKIFLGSLIHLVNNAMAVTASYISMYDMSREMMLMGIFVFVLIAIAIAALVYYSVYGIKRRRISRIRTCAARSKIPTGTAIVRTVTNPGIFMFVIMLGVTLYIKYLL